VPLAAPPMGLPLTGLIMSHNSAAGHWFSLDLGRSKAFCHSRAWPPREESRVFLAETSPCVSAATEPAPRRSSATNGHLRAAPWREGQQIAGAQFRLERERVLCEAFSPNCRRTLPKASSLPPSASGASRNAESIVLCRNCLKSHSSKVHYADRFRAKLRELMLIDVATLRRKPKKPAP